MNTISEGDVGVVQIGLNTCDLPATLRLYSEAFGFVNAGAQVAWGDILQLQALPHDGRCIVWWLVGAQPFFQFEIFHHTSPAQRPKPQDWKPSDLGWTGFGIRVDNFDGSIRALARNGVEYQSNLDDGGARSYSFRDPYAAVLVEVIERTSGSAAQGPEVLYVTRSVDNLATARDFYANVARLDLASLESVRDETRATAWADGKVTREGFVVNTVGPRIEVVQFTPQGDPKAADYRLSDQGIMNIALGSRSNARVAQIINAHLERRPGEVMLLRAPGLVATYLLDRDIELEVLSAPPEFDEAIGFLPANPFIGLVTADGEGMTVAPNKRVVL